MWTGDKNLSIYLCVFDGSPHTTAQSFFKHDYLCLYIQVQNLALRAHLPGALATAHRVILKPSAQSQTQSQAASSSKTAICALKTKQPTDTSAETGPSDVTRLAPGELLCSKTDFRSVLQKLEQVFQTLKWLIVNLKSQWQNCIAVRIKNKAGLRQGLFIILI